LVSRVGNPWSNTYFVDGPNGGALASGADPANAISTIQIAVNKCARGDRVLIRPQDYAIGHGIERYEECVTIAAVNTGKNYAGGTSYPILRPSDISIIGVMNTINPEFGVRWKFGTTYCLINDIPALHVENIGFFAEGSTAAVLLRNNGISDTRRGTDGTTFYNCNFKGGALVIADGGDGTTVEECTFHTAYGGGSGGLGAIYVSCSNNPGARLRIVANRFYGGSTTEQPATCYITILPPMALALVEDNKFGKIPGDGHYFNADGAANTGYFLNNIFAFADVVLETSIHIGSMIQAGNRDTIGFIA
jgi:hypothetical protein